MLLYAESFDSDNTLADRWQASLTGGVVAGGRNGTKAVYGTDQGGGQRGYLQKTLPGGGKQTAIFGGAWLQSGSTFANAGGCIVQAIEGSSTPGTNKVQISLHVNTALGTLYIRRGGSPAGGYVTGDDGTLLVAGTRVLVPGIYYYVEMKVYVHGSTGRVIVRINGVVDIDFTGNTLGAVNLLVDAWRPILSSSNPVYWDDLYFADNTGAQNNDFLGDVRVEALFPNATGAAGTWTPNAAGANYTKVNEASPDSDTTYVSTGVVGNIDEYNFTDSTAVAAVIKGIQTGLFARKEDAGARTIAPVIRQTATDYVGTAVALGVAYAEYQQMYELNPATGVAFTLAEVNADQYGVKLVT